MVNCKDRIILPVKYSTTGNLIINGNISNDVEQNTLKLGRTTDASKGVKPVTDATITIFDASGQRETYVEQGNGKYLLKQQTIIGKKGGVYWIEILLNDGSVYRSKPDTIPDSNLAKDIVYRDIVSRPVITEEGFSVPNQVVRIIMDTRLPLEQTSNYLRWGVSEAYSIFAYCPPGASLCQPPCYIFPEYNFFHLLVVDTKDYSSPELKGLLLQEKDVDFSFQRRHYFNVTQTTMSKSAYEYWKKVQELVSRTGSVYDTPPAPIVGNIYRVDDLNEKVYGFFEANLQQTTRTFTDRGNIPIPLPVCDTYPVIYNFCSDCLVIPTSTYSKPAWFKDY